MALHRVGLTRGQAQLTTSTAHTLGKFIADVMHQQGHNNVSLASMAGVSEGVIRNLLKHGSDPRAKDPDPRTLRRVADALGINALKLFRLAGYIPPAPNANSVRAEFLADVFDELTPEKQDAVLSVLEAMSKSYTHKEAIQAMRRDPSQPLAGIEASFFGLTRFMANDLIAQYQMVSPVETHRIEPDATTYGIKWKEMSETLRRRIIALIEHKLSLDYDPTMVDSDWR